MRRITGLIAAVLILAAGSAQAVDPPTIHTQGGYVQATPVTPYDGSGAIITGGGSGAPYVLTSTGFQQVGSFATATGFTPPATSTVCFIYAEGNAVRFRTDGTNPTATIGQPLSTGQQLQLTASLSTVKFIPQTGSATLDVDCYK